MSEVFDDSATITKENLEELYAKLTKWYEVGRHQLRGDADTQRDSLLATARLWAFHIFFNQNVRRDETEVILIGGNPKGHAYPFHPLTISGRRLRGIISEIGLRCELTNMTANPNDIPSENEIKILKEKCKKKKKIVFLGRFVEKTLKQHIPEGIYLPHPASRRSRDLIKLKQGLLTVAYEASL